MFPCSVDVQSIAIFEFDVGLFVRGPRRVNSVHGIWSLAPLRLLIHLVAGRLAAPSAAAASTAAAESLAGSKTSGASRQPAADTTNSGP